MESDEYYRLQKELNKLTVRLDTASVRCRVLEAELEIKNEMISKLKEDNRLLCAHRDMLVSEQVEL